MGAGLCVLTVLITANICWLGRLRRPTNALAGAPRRLSSAPVSVNVSICAGSRLFAHKKVFDQMVEGISNVAKSIKLGPGLDPETQMGPLVSEEQFARVTGYIESGKKEGAKIKTGGTKGGNGGGYFVTPTVITDTKPNMKVVREEIFGPVLVVESPARQYPPIYRRKYRASERVRPASLSRQWCAACGRATGTGA